MTNYKTNNGNVTINTPLGTLVGLIQTNGFVLGGQVLKGFRSNNTIAIVSDYWGDQNNQPRYYEYPINVLFKL